MIYVVILLLFVLLILVHEYGHFLVAKRNGVEVEEFGIGFPPRIAGREMGKGIFRGYYTLNLLPLGGFVKLKGENSADKRKGSFGAASYWSKTKIIMAGVAMNMLAAMAILTFLAWTGMPQVLDDQFSVSSDTEVVSSKVLATYVGEDSPAQGAGIVFGNELISIDDQSILSTDQLFELTEERAGEQAEVVFINDAGEKVSQTVQLRPEDSEEGYFGVSPTQVTLEKSTWSAPVTGIVLTLQLTWKTFVGLIGLIGSLFSGNVAEAGESVTGPVGIVVLLKDVSVIGPNLLMFFVAVISVTLAVMNALPIPALDGGRLFVSGVFKAIKKPLTPKLENYIHGIGFAVLMALILVVSIKDVQRFF